MGGGQRAGRGGEGLALLSDCSLLSQSCLRHPIRGNSFIPEWGPAVAALPAPPPRGRSYQAPLPCRLPEEEQLCETWPQTCLWVGRRETSSQEPHLPLPLPLVPLTASLLNAVGSYFNRSAFEETPRSLLPQASFWGALGLGLLRRHPSADAVVYL